MPEMTQAQTQENTRDWWDKRYRLTKDFLYSREPSSFLWECLELIPEKAKVLDLACGEGRNAVALALKGVDVKAIDFSEVALERAQNLAKNSGAQLEFKKMDLDFFIPDLMSFDVILCIDFRPPPSLLKNLIRGLKKNGYLIMENPLTTACLEKKSLEVFECFKPGELLRLMGGGMNYRVIFYSELEPDFQSKKVQMIAQKTEML